MVDIKQRIKTVLQEAEIYKTQGLVAEAYEKYRSAADLINSIEKLKNKSGLLKAVSEKTADQIDRMLQQVIKQGTGRKALGLRGPAAGKTGTTDQNMDAWFIGYSSHFLAGVWVGHDNNVSLGKDASGGQVAAPIWLDFMKKVEAAGN